MVKTNFELSLKAADQCGVKDQGGAVAKLAVAATAQSQRLWRQVDGGAKDSRSKRCSGLTGCSTSRSEVKSDVRL